VSDSDGLTDSSIATVRVSSPKDDPPRARPGSDQVITLPLNHLTLLGNHSTDDHAITSYLWSLHPRSLTQKVTMQVIRSIFILLRGKMGCSEVKNTYWSLSVTQVFILKFQRRNKR